MCVPTSNDEPAEKKLRLEEKKRSPVQQKFSSEITLVAEKMLNWEVPIQIATVIQPVPGTDANNADDDGKRTQQTSAMRLILLSINVSTPR